MGASRGWMLSAVTIAAVGILFLLWGFGVDLGKWWPAVFVAFGLASLIRGMQYSENIVWGLLLMGWGVIGVLTLHATQLGIVHALPFLIGAGLVWIPVALLFGHGRK
jgi:predicted anti-sigma-YlaC factor YlaD